MKQAREEESFERIHVYVSVWNLWTADGSWQGSHERRNTKKKREGRSWQNTADVWKLRKHEGDRERDKWKRGKTAPCVCVSRPAPGVIESCGLHSPVCPCTLDAVTFLWQASRHHCSSVHPWPACGSLLSAGKDRGKPDAAAAHSQRKILHHWTERAAAVEINNIYLMWSC